MPVYNGEKYLKEAIESVLKQTENDFEFLIIDDGSIDATESIVNSFADKRIRYEKRQRGGLVAALNYGISIAQGIYIARMDADDRALAERFSKQAATLDLHPEIAVCGSWALKIDEAGRPAGQFSFPKITPKEVRLHAFVHNPIIHPAAMIRRSVLLEVGGYRPFWKHVEDYELWTRILPKYACVNIGEPLLEYRLHAGQITQQKRIRMLSYGLLIRIAYLWRTLLSLIS
ncbi:MAG: glycosyl transferase family 2 [Candidatus Taylorbacteria bacterium]|nr:glycosyl transferase family 2 [Candidatus Taylorbacteria bacterium]